MERINPDGDHRLDDRVARTAARNTAHRRDEAPSGTAIRTACLARYVAAYRMRAF